MKSPYFVKKSDIYQIKKNLCSRQEIDQTSELSPQLLLLDLIQQNYIKILLFYSIEPSYKTSQMFCFEDTLLQNKTFKKEALYEIFQMIWIVLISIFLELVLNLHIYLNNISKIWFPQGKKSFLRKNLKLKNSQTPKSKAIFGIFLPISPKSARKKVY